MCHSCAGPAGLAAALYCCRDGLKTLIFEKFQPGGQINNTDRIENYPGIERIDGPALVERMRRQAETFGAVIKTSAEVETLARLPDGRIAVFSNGHQYTARTVILSVGSDYRKLGVPGEARLSGAGVSYCGTCDAPFFRDKEVVSVGGGNSAVEETLHLTKFARRVTLVHRRNQLRAAKVLADELAKKAAGPQINLFIQYNTIVTTIEGKDKVESVRLKDVKTGIEHSHPCDGVFIFAGMVPNTGFLKGFVELTEAGFIKCDCAYLRTNVPGVFAAGDCRVGAVMQLATAAGDGVVAAMMLRQYFRDPNWWNEPPSDILQPGGW